jgi:hypothetical protein
LPYFIAPPRANGDPADAPSTHLKDSDEQEEEDEEDETPLIAPSNELDDDEENSEDQVEELEDSEAEDGSDDEEEEEAGPEVEEEEREVTVEEVRLRRQHQGACVREGGCRRGHLEFLEQSVGISTPEL